MSGSTIPLTSEELADHLYTASTSTPLHLITALAIPALPEHRVCDLLAKFDNIPPGGIGTCHGLPQVLIPGQPGWAREPWHAIAAGREGPWMWISAPNRRYPY